MKKHISAFQHCSSGVNSISQWLWPSLLGTNIIIVGIISDTNWASCPAPLYLHVRISIHLHSFQRNQPILHRNSIVSRAHCNSVSTLHLSSSFGMFSMTHNLLNNFRILCLESKEKSTKSGITVCTQG